MAYKFQKGPAILTGSITGSTTITAVKFYGNGAQLQGVTGSGGGDFSGPGSSTDNAIVRFSGTAGKTGQNSGITIADTTNNVAGAGTLSGSGYLVNLAGLKLDTGAVIGTAADTDLVTLTANLFTVAGVMSASTDVKGRDLVLDVGANIGISSDTDLLTLTANTVTLAGALTGSGAVTAAQGVFERGLDLSTGATATSVIEIADNLASALKIAAGSDTYMTFATTNSSQAITIASDAGTELQLGNSSGELVAAGMLKHEAGAIFNTKLTASAGAGQRCVLSAGEYCLVVSGSVASTVKLPTIAGMGEEGGGYPIYIKRSYGGATGVAPMLYSVTVSASSADQIDGASTIVLNTAGASVLLVASGSNWHVF